MDEMNTQIPEPTRGFEFQSHWDSWLTSTQVLGWDYLAKGEMFSDVSVLRIVILNFEFRFYR